MIKKVLFITQTNYTSKKHKIWISRAKTSSLTLLAVSFQRRIVFKLNVVLTSKWGKSIKMKSE